jgi:hypothetical protein
MWGAVVRIAPQPVINVNAPKMLGKNVLIERALLM